MDSGKQCWLTYYLAPLISSIASVPSRNLVLTLVLLKNEKGSSIADKLLN